MKRAGAIEKSPEKSPEAVFDEARPFEKPTKTVAAVFDLTKDDGIVPVMEVEAIANLRAELDDLKKGALRKRAAALGVDDDDLEEADDAKDTKAAIIELIVALKEAEQLRQAEESQRLEQEKLEAQKSEEVELQRLEARKEVIKTCLKMNEMGINQGTSGNVSVRVPGGFVITASGIPYESMQPEQVPFCDLDGGYYGAYLPSSEWRMHYDIYKEYPQAQAVVHAHPTFCTALATQRRGIPAFHYMVAAAGGKEIQCTDYATFGTQDLSDTMLRGLGPRRSVLLANHGMICYGPNLDKALWLANETECLAMQYMSALSTGVPPEILSDKEMDIMLAKFKTYGKQPNELSALTDFERRHAVAAPAQRAEATISGPIPHLKERKRVIETCLKMNAMGINQGTSGNVSCRVPGGFVITASGIPYETMQPEHIPFMDELKVETMWGTSKHSGPGYYGKYMPSSEWRMHYDIYRRFPDAQAVVHAHPTYCTAIACQRRNIPAFHYMVAAAGGKEIQCADYASFGTQELSDSLLTGLGSRRSTLLANHGMICYGPNLDKALWLANETECLAKQYICALSSGTTPTILSDDEMEVMLAKFKTYGKQPHELAKLTDFERRHAVSAPRFCKTYSPSRAIDLCCMPPGENGGFNAVTKRGDRPFVQDIPDLPVVNSLDQEQHSITRPPRSSDSSWLDAASFSVIGHGVSTLLLAFRMSLMNAEQMRVARAAGVAAGSLGAKEAARLFLTSTYYKSWSRAQLNNAEYAPMLALLCMCLKYKAHRSARQLTLSEGAACISSVVSSLLFVFAAARQGTINHAMMKPGRGGMSPLRPIGAMGRYISQAWLLLELLLRR